MKKIMMAAVLMVGLSFLPIQSQAADFEVQNTFEDTMYGGLLGALVGGGAMLISGSPSKHWNYISTGAGIGIIAGAIYGVASGVNAFAKLENGQLQLGVPMPELAVSSDGQVVSMNTPLFESRF
ncbi:MAG: hypothetical protein Q9M11_01320 [Mariprofundaceae bacterium]|nr:hypothetical protein [Mariprofundaceae bacterium]